MSVLTRIKNNQILDSTIYANAKIVPGSIVGSLFNSNLTMTSDVTITGNLTVQGASTYLTVASTNTYVNDPLIVMNNAFAGTNTYDLGFVFNRGTLQNVALIWNEFNKEFRLVGTTETGTTYGNINQSSTANLRIGNLTVDYVTSIGSLTTTGFINTSGNISAAVGVFGEINSTGLINTTGNVSASQVSVATLNATGLINTLGNISASEGSFATITATGLINTLGNISTAQLNAGQINTTGNVVATVFNGGAVNVSGNVAAATVLAQLVTADDATFGNVNAEFIGNTGTQFTGSSINLSGNVLASSIITSYLSASTATVGNIAAVTIGNTGALIQGLTAQFDGNVIGGLAQFAAINSTPVGNATASTGAFTTLSAANSLWANASIATTTQGTGAVVIPNGGISVSGNANIGSTLTVAGATQLNSTLGVGGITTFTNSTNATTINDGAVIIQGGASVLKDLYVGGNLYAANIVGIQANVITVQDPLLFLAPDYTFPYNYDIGIYSAFTGTGLTTAGNVLQHTAIVRHQETNTWTFASNLAAPGGGHLILDSNTVYDPVKAGNLELTVTTDSTNATTGALIVAGGAGIGGNIFHTGTQLQTSASNYIFATTPTTVDAFKAATTLNVGATSGTLTINNPTVVGTQTTQALYNTVTDTLNFARAANITMGHTSGITTLQGAANIQATTASVDSATGALKVKGGVGIGGNIFINDAYIDTAQSNFILGGTPTTVDAFKAATALNFGATTGTLTINNPTVVGTQATQALYNTVTDTLNFARAANITMGHTDGTTSLQGNANIQSVTTSINAGTGALKVQGGVGVRGNLNIAGDNTGTAYSGRGALTVGLDIAGGTLYPENLAQFTSNANSFSRISIQNVSSLQNAASEFTVIANNGSNLLSYLATGITSTNWNSSVLSPIIQANDGYTYTTGNLVLASDRDVVLASSGTSTVGVRISAVNSNVGVQYSTVSTSATTGALTVVGGAGFGSNIWVATGAVINSTQTNQNFTIRTTSSTAGLIYNTAQQSLILNGGDYASNTLPVLGATLAVRSTDSILIPVGSTAQRPSNAGNIDVTGMLRYNTSISNLEWYDGSQWAVPGSAQTTVITDESFTGNGVQVVFTLGNASSTNSCIVSINGVLQIPVTAYGISGTTLTFTEAPADGDQINVRKITTTASVTSLSSANGYMVFDVSDASGIYANITGGTSAPTPRISTNAEGLVGLVNDAKIVVRGSEVNIAANATPYTLDSFTQTRYVTAKYIVSAKKDSTNFESYEALITTDQNGNAYITTYAIVNNGTTMGILSANVLAGNVQLYYTTNTNMTNANVRVYTTYIQ